MKRGAPLTRRTPLKPGKPLANGSTLTRRSAPKRVPVSPASPGQREKVRDRPCLSCGERPCDPAHLAPRGGGLATGCDGSYCVIALCRSCHRSFDAGELDVLPDLLAQGHVAEVVHALTHYRGDMIALLQRLTGERWAPVVEARCA